MSIEKMKIYFTLFRITFYISAFTFGGGYIVIPMMRKYFVDDLELISEQELLDMAAIAQSSPGAIAVNIAVLIGYRIAGTIGAIISAVGTVLPPLVILSIISLFYKAFRDNRVVSAVLKGMEAGVAATIVDLIIDMSQGILKEENWLLTLMAPITFIASFIFNINVLVIIISCALLSFAQAYIKSCKEGLKMAKTIFTLFIRFLQIGLFSIGGGYAIIPLIQEQVVNASNWLTLQEYTDIITISQMTPGPLVVNTASFVGIRIAGVPGAIAATLGSILSGFIISIFLYNFFNRHKDIDSISSILKGLRSSSVGLIAAAASTIILIAFFGTATFDIRSIHLNITAVIVFIISLLLLRKYKLNPILIMVLSGIVGLILY